MNSIAKVENNNQAFLNGANPMFVQRARILGLCAAYVAFALALTSPISWLLNYPILRPNIPVYTGAHSIGLAFSLLLPLTVLLLYSNSGVRIGKIIWYVILACSGIVLLEYMTPGELPFA